MIEQGMTDKECRQALREMGLKPSRYYLHFQHDKYDREEVMAIYRATDLAYVTSDALMAAGDKFHRSWVFKLARARLIAGLREIRGEK
jgi:hypothetical protein